MSSNSSERSANCGCVAMKGLFSVVKVGPVVFMMEQITDLGVGLDVVIWA